MSSELKVALISRFMPIDIPYQAAWLEHYLQIGVDHIYLFFIDKEENAWETKYKNDFEEVVLNRSILLQCNPELRDKITVINHFKAYSNPNAFLSAFDRRQLLDMFFIVSDENRQRLEALYPPPKNINHFERGERFAFFTSLFVAPNSIPKYDYLLHVDSDEFLYLVDDEFVPTQSQSPPSITLQRFLEQKQQKSEKKLNHIHFNWLMCPSRENFVEDFNKTFAMGSNPKYFIARGKSMALISDMSFAGNDINDPHVFLLRKNIAKIEPNPDQHPSTSNPRRVNLSAKITSCLVHFSYRGIYDCYNKMMHQNLSTHRNDQDRFHQTFSQLSADEKIPIHSLPSRVQLYLAELCGGCDGKGDSKCKEYQKWLDRVCCHHGGDTRNTNTNKMFHCFTPTDENYLQSLFFGGADKDDFVNKIRKLDNSAIFMDYNRKLDHNNLKPHVRKMAEGDHRSV